MPSQGHLDKQLCGIMNGDFLIASSMPLCTELIDKSSLAKQVFKNEGQSLCV